MEAFTGSGPACGRAIAFAAIAAGTPDLVRDWDQIRYAPNHLNCFDEYIVNVSGGSRMTAVRCFPGDEIQS
jgi:hypothetical protein